MAPIKLEDHIREQLQEREIKTSNNSWEKLQQQIDSTSKKKNNKGWFYLAASIVGIIIISSLLLNKQQVITKPSNNIVEVNDNEDKIEFDSKVVVSGEETKIDDTSEPIRQKEIKNPLRKEIVKEEKLINKKEKLVMTDVTILETNSSKTNLKENTLIVENNKEPQEVNEEEKFINSKVEEVVAQIKKSSNSITDEEINALLNKAQKDIHSKKLIFSNKVDATKLLSIVEDELETNFRDRVFEALGDGYEKVRTAVVNREY